MSKFPYIIFTVVVIIVVIGGIFYIITENEETKTIVTPNTNTTNTATKIPTNTNTVSPTNSEVAIEDPNLVVNWKFDENTGDVILDTASGYSGKIYGGAEWITGKIGSALSFDGIDDYVDLSQSALADASQTTLSDISSLTQGTITFWFKYTSTLDQQAIIPIFYLGAADENAQSNMFIIEIGHGSTESGEYGSLNPDNKRIYTTWIKNNQEPFLCFDSDINIEENTWHHFAVVVGPDGNTGFFDGVEMTNRDYNFGTTTDTSFLSSIPVAEKLMFGYGRTHHEISPDFVNMTGALDELRIYDRPLTAEEIQELVQ